MPAPLLDTRSEVVNDVNRRGFLGGASPAALLAACGGEPNQTPSTGAAAQDAGFPVIVVHKYGDYPLGRIVPMLAAALDGDPATKPTS